MEINGAEWNKYGQWEQIKDVLIRYPPREFVYSYSNALFSLASIIRHPVGKKTPASSDDWKFVYKHTDEKLSEMQKMGASIVILDNYFEIGRGTIQKNIVTEMIDHAIVRLEAKKIFVAVVLVLTKCTFAKPFTNSWQILKDIYSRAEKRGECKASPQTEYSIYVGVAGGRIATLKNSEFGKWKKDACYVDRAYAYNLNLTYKTPEEIFEGDIDRPHAYPSSVLTMEEKKEYLAQNSLEADNISWIHIEQIIKKYRTKIIVIMCGRPGSGKTTTSLRVHGMLESTFTSCKIVESASMSTTKKLVNLVRVHMTENANVIVDACHPDVDSRAPLLALADELGYKVLIIYCDVDDKLAKHLNQCKIQTTHVYNQKPVSKTLYATYNKKHNDIIPLSNELESLKSCYVIKYKPIIFDTPAFWNIYNI